MPWCFHVPFVCLFWFLFAKWSHCNHNIISPVYPTNKAAHNTIETPLTYFTHVSWVLWAECGISSSGLEPLTPELQSHLLHYSPISCSDSPGLPECSIFPFWLLSISIWASQTIHLLISPPYYSIVLLPCRQTTLCQACHMVAAHTNTPFMIIEVKLVR